MEENRNPDYWRQVAKDAIDARDSMQERQRATVAECERLRTERDNAIRDMGRYQEQVRKLPPDLSELVRQASDGNIVLTVSIRIEKPQK